MEPVLEPEIVVEEVKDEFLDKYGFPEEYFKNHVLDSGGDYNIAKLALEGLPYDKFKERYLEILRKEQVNSEDDSDYLSLDNKKMFESIEDFDLDERDYNSLLEDIADTVSSLKYIYSKEKTTESQNVKKYRFPIETILNGNFPPENLMDKSLLDEDMKTYFGVQGLPDDLYDLYIDKEGDRVIPIYYDKSTVNEQWYAFTVFLEELFHKIGIPEANHKTPLLLFDRDLMGIDVDKVTSPELMRKIAIEGRRNPYYHFREIARNEPTGDNGVKTRYFLNIATWTYLWLYSQNINTFREQSRQTGKTYDMGHSGSMEFSYASERCSIGLFHFIYTKATENRKTWIGYGNLYPPFLQMHNIITKVIKGKSVEQMSPEPMQPSSTKIIENKKTRVKFMAIAIGTSKMSAEQAGRGSTLRLVFGDELNFIKYIKVAFTALMFAHGTARKLALANGYRTGMHFASTAGTLDTEQGRMMYKFVYEDMVKFDPVLFSLTHSELKSYIESKSKNRFVLISYSYKDLGFSEKWLDETIAGKTVEEVRTDIFNDWLSTTTGGIFQTEALSRIDSIVKRNPAKTYLFNKLNIFKFNGMYDSFEDLIKQVHVLSIGMDFANGDLGDSTSFTGIDLVTGRRLFDFEDNQIDNPDCVILIKAFIKHIVSIRPDIKMIINPEIDGPGRAAIIPALKKDPEIEKYIFRSYYETNKELREPVIKSVSYSIDTKTIVEYGTSMRKHRDVLFNSLLFELVDKYPYAFEDLRTANELKTLVRNRNKKILAKSGFHDDKICSTLHAYSPLFIDRFNESLELFHKILVNVNDLEADPLTSTVFNLKDDIEGINGKVYWKVYKHKDPSSFNGYYETIKAHKIENGIKRDLTYAEITEEAKINEELDHALRSMIPRSLNSYENIVKSRLNRENALLRGHDKSINNDLRRSSMRNNLLLNNKNKKNNLLY